jgi:hypothetical protein
MIDPCSDTTEKTVVRALLTIWFAVFGPPKKIITDKGRDDVEFGNKLC